MSVIEVKNLSVVLDGNTVLDDVSFSLERGDYVGLVGPNGAGKTTLIKTLLGQKTPTRGSIFIQKGVTIGYVPQHHNLSQVVPISIREVIRMGKRKNKNRSISEVLNLVGLSEEFLYRNFHDLSGGQAQRVIIARALISDPNVLLFDEPLTGLDFETKLKLYELLARLNEEQKLTILFVSHEVEYIVNSCHRILCLNKHLHEGCHALDFVQGGNAQCTLLQKEAGVLPIHHHHKAS